MSVTGIGISAQIWITMYKGSHEASVEILPNFNSLAGSPSNGIEYYLFTEEYCISRANIIRSKPADNYSQQAFCLLRLQSQKQSNLCPKLFFAKWV